MQEFSVTVDAQGQVTLPDEARRLLGVRAGDQLTLRVEPGNGSAHLAPRPMTLEEIAGSVPPLNRPEDYEELVRIAKEE